MSELVLATGNPGKLRELAALLAPLEIEVVAQSALGVPEVEETGLSFVENALLKARNAARHTGLAALADDSGLCVDALDGAPGVRSARFAGPGADDATNRARLRAALEGVEPARRGARFVCVLTLLRHAEDPLPLICQGLWEGVIARSERGDHGFGYDPLFELPGRDMTAAQLPPEEKNRLSHRGRALAGLREALGTRPL